MATTNGNGSSARVEVEERQLPVKLTEAELLDRGQQMADAEMVIDVNKGKRRVISGKINEGSKLRNTLAKVIESGSELRQVRCHWVEDFAKNVWRLVRQDTGEQVDTRAMTADDRQGALGLVAATPSPKPRRPTSDELATLEQADDGMLYDPAQGGRAVGTAPPKRTRTKKPAPLVLAPVDDGDNDSNTPPPRTPRTRTKRSAAPTSGRHGAAAQTRKRPPNSAAAATTQNASA